jgi:hypothetical protein
MMKYKNNFKDYVHLIFLKSRFVTGSGSIEGGEQPQTWARQLEWKALHHAAKSVATTWIPRQKKKEAFEFELGTRRKGSKLSLPTIDGKRNRRRTPPAMDAQNGSGRRRWKEERTRMSGIKGEPLE